MKKNLLPHLALLGTNIFFAINFTAVKYLIDNQFTSAFGLNYVRILVTAILLWTIYLFSPKKERIKKIHYKRFVICSMLGIVINQLLFIKGLSLTYSIHASLLMLTTPIFIVVISAMILKEKLSFVRLFGLLLGAGGATVLILGRKNQMSAMDVILGDFFIVINAICYSYYFVLVKPLMKRYSPITVIRMLFSIGAILALPVCWMDFQQIPWFYFNPSAILAISLVVIGGTFLAYLFNLYGIKHLGPSISGSYIYTQPFFAAIIAMLVLHEAIDLYKIIAAILIFTGVFLSNKSKNNVQDQSEN